MPRELVSDEFIERFGSQIVREEMGEDEAHALTGGRLSPSSLRRMSPRKLAEYFARAKWFHARQFDALVGVFGVSPDAMARRLTELKLIV